MQDPTLYQSEWGRGQHLSGGIPITCGIDVSLEGLLLVTRYLSHDL